ncbi:MAG: P-loop NTPase [Verrucomicrobiia bacterium]
MLTQNDILDRLKTVKYPGFSRDILSFGLLKSIDLRDQHADILLELTSRDDAIAAQIETAVKEALAPLTELKSLSLRIDVRAPVGAALQAGGMPRASLPGIRHVIAVASGKGGVGKSTVAANLAAALGQTGLRVGLCDCDLYGPSQGLMLGAHERPTVTDDDKIVPVTRHGVRLMSMSLLLDTEESPVVLRGPMVTRYTQQFLRDVAWGDLDLLLLDLPPGTGDIQLTIVQTVALTGAVVVTTPQEVALIDARKAVRMFHKVNVPILGLIENMAFFLCPSDGVRYDIFGSGGGAREAEKLGVPLLAEIPIDIPTRQAGDRGIPVVLDQPQSASAQAFHRAAQQLIPRLSNRSG